MEIFTPISHAIAMALSKNEKLEGIITSGEFGSGVYGYANLEGARNVIPDKKDMYILELKVLDSTGIEKVNDKIFIPSIDKVQPQKFYRAEEEDDYWHRKFQSNKRVDESLIKLNLRLSESQIRKHKKSNKSLLLERMVKHDSSFKINLNEESNRNFYLKKLNESNYNNTYHSLTEHFINHNKLTGNLNEDVKFLKEFSLLLEEDDFDPFAHLKQEDKIDEKDDCLLSFSPSNAKLKHPYFSLPAGYTCPFADVCKSFANKKGEKFASTGKNIKDHGDIRCYASSEEARYPNVRKSRWKNFDLLQEFKGDVEGMADLINKSLEHFGKNTTLFRIHESGDFYSQEYFDAWLKVARTNPSIKFYAYTKALPYWVARLDSIPENLKLTASKGGKNDELIDKYNLKQAVIVNDVEDAKKLNLPIDVDDSLAHSSDKDFALLLHGTQSKESGLTSQSRKNSQLLKKLKNR